MSSDRPSIKVIHENVLNAFEKRNAEREAQGLHTLTAPSRETTRRAIRELDPFAVITARFGEAAARERFKPVLNGLDLTRPLQRVEIDEWEIDLMTLMHSSGLIDLFTEEERLQLGLDKTAKRWTLTVAICCTTRCIVGMVISTAPKARAAVQVLQMVVSNKGRWADLVGALGHWDMYGIATPVGKAPGSMVNWAKSAEISRKKMQLVLSAVFGGRLQRVMRLENEPGLSGLLVDPWEVKSLTPRGRPGMSIDLAFMMLGIGAAAGKRLVSGQFGGKVLKTVSVPG